MQTCTQKPRRRGVPERVRAGAAAAVAGAALLSLPAAVAALQAPAPATGVLDSLIQSHVTTFGMAGGVLSGPGAALLADAARGRQFVLLGENHNTAAIPAFTVALFGMLQEAEGFEYLALEEGPALGLALSRAVRASSAGDGAFRLGLRHPSAFHMYTEEELRMMDRIGARSRARGDPIWGVNQEYGLSHVYARLVELAATADGRAAAGAALARSLRYEGERYGRDTSYITAIATAADFEVLRRALRPSPGSEVAPLIDQAALSHRIYAPYAERPRPHFTRFHASAVAREENMKRLFADRYRAAVAAGDSLPRVLVKSGHVHLNRGLGASNEVFTLGNFLSELATFNGGGSLHVYVLLAWPDLGESFVAPFVPHIVAGGHTLFDLRPLQPWAAHNRIPELDPELRRMLVGYDLLVILEGTTPGAFEALRTPNFRRWPGGG